MDPIAVVRAAVGARVTGKQISRMNQPHQKHQQRVQAIELAVLADQLLLSIQDVLVDGSRVVVPLPFAL